MNFRPLPAPSAATGTTSTRGGSHWSERAACNGEDTSRFFPPGDSHSEMNPRLVAELRAHFCSHCPVADLCFADALDGNVRVGVRGGVDMATVNGRSAAARAARAARGAA